MKTILYPTDFSDNAQNALRYVIPFAQRMQASILLLHVYPFPAVYPEAPLSIMERETEILRIAAEEHLAILAKEIQSEAPELTCKRQSMQGPVSSQILTAASEHKVDWIIMGTQGRSRIDQMLFGSVTAQIISQANCPVLAIPEVAFFHGIKRIVFASDFQEGDFEALEQLVEVARLFDAELQVIHVSELENARIKTSFQVYADGIQEIIPYDKMQFHLLQSSNVQQGLEEFVNNCGGDLLAMNAKKRGFFSQLFHRSHTRKMAYQSKKPILALHH